MQTPRPQDHKIYGGQHTGCTGEGWRKDALIYIFSGVNALESGKL